jgi:hypothetical protein
MHPIAVTVTISNNANRFGYVGDGCRANDWCLNGNDCVINWNVWDAYGVEARAGIRYMAMPDNAADIRKYLEKINQ